MNPYAEEAEFLRLESEHLKELDKKEGNGLKWYSGDKSDEDQYQENESTTQVEQDILRITRRYIYSYWKDN